MSISWKIKHHEESNDIIKLLTRYKKMWAMVDYKNQNKFDFAMSKIDKLEEEIKSKYPFLNHYSNLVEIAYLI